MRILAIETSCDETAVSIVECSGDLESPHFEVRAESLISQVALHAEFGGVVPNLAKREHAKNLVPLLKDALAQAGIESISRPPLSEKEIADIHELCIRESELAQNITENLFAAGKEIQIPAIDLIAVTQGPGLEPALWVGINFAKILQKIWAVPAIGVNHMEGHIASALADDSGVAFPAIALLISGGHTEIILASELGKYRIIGQTKDDAVGEAYDKVARILGLSYPGGPEVARLAAEAREEHTTFGASEITARRPLPRPMIATHDLDFSFSGLKTAVLYQVRDIEKIAAESNSTDGSWKKEMALEFEEAVADVLLKKTIKAIETYDAKTLIIGGGVIANTYLRSRFEGLHDRVTVKIPDKKLTTDNATMIAFAAYISMKTGTERVLEPDSRAQGNLTW